MFCPVIRDRLLVKDGKLIGRMSQYSGREYWLGVIRDQLPL